MKISQAEGVFKFCEHYAPVFNKFSIIGGVKYVICKFCGLPVKVTGVPVDDK